MDYAALKTLIQATPAAADRYAIGDDTGTAAILNDKTQRGPVPLAELSSFALQTGLMGAVQAMDSVPIGSLIGDSGQTMTLQIKGLLRSVITVIDNASRLTVAHLDAANGVAMLDGLQAIGLLSAPVRQAMVALGGNRLSLAEANLGSLASADDVARTRGI